MTGSPIAASAGSSIRLSPGRVNGRYDGVRQRCRSPCRRQSSLHNLVWASCKPGMRTPTSVALSNDFHEVALPTPGLSRAAIVDEVAKRCFRKRNYRGNNSHQ